MLLIVQARLEQINLMLSLTTTGMVCHPLALNSQHERCRFSICPQPKRPPTILAWVEEKVQVCKGPRHTLASDEVASSECGTLTYLFSARNVRRRMDRFLSSSRFLAQKSPSSLLSLVSSMSPLSLIAMHKMWIGSISTTFRHKHSFFDTFSTARFA